MVETVSFMVKRKIGNTADSRTDHTYGLEVMLRAIAQNLRRLLELRPD